MFKPLAISLVLFSFPVAVFATDADNVEQQYLEECKLYAQEDNISADELDTYLNECVENMKQTVKEVEKD